MSVEDQSDSSSPKKSAPPFWLLLITLAALLWYLMDFSMYYMRVTMTPETLASMPAAQQHFFKDIPSWVNGVFALEVFGGLFGCIALLFRRRWALLLFGISLLGVVCQTFYIWFISDHVATMGAPAIVMPLIAVLITLILIVLTRKAINRNWLR